MALKNAILPNPVIKSSGLLTQGNDDSDDAPIFKGDDPNLGNSKDTDYPCWHCGTIESEPVYLCVHPGCRKRPFQKCNNRSCQCQGRT